MAWKLVSGLFFIFKEFSAKRNISFFTRGP